MMDGSKIGSLLFLVFALLAPAPAGAAGVDVEIEGADRFILRGTWYAAAPAPGPAVLLLHQCNRDRTSWEGLAASLVDAGLHVLTLDFRGFGESVSESATDFHAQSEELWPYFEDDTAAAFRFLVSRGVVDGTRIGLAGASCGGSQAMLLANREEAVRTVVFLSSSIPWVDESDLKRFASTRPNPLLCIAAEEDRGTYQRTKRVFQESKNGDSRFILYKGNAHGVPLFEQDETLVEVITDWFAVRLR